MRILEISDVRARLGFRELRLDDFQARTLSLSPAGLGLGSEPRLLFTLRE